jgi:hypothetical protein
MEIFSQNTALQLVLCVSYQPGLMNGTCRFLKSGMLFYNLFQNIFFSKAEPWWFRKWNATMNEWITLSFSQSIIKSGKKVETRDHRLQQWLNERAPAVHDTSRASNTWFDPQIKWHELVGSSVGCSRWYFHKIWPIWCTYSVRNNSYRIHRTGGRPFFHMINNT